MPTPNVPGIGYADFWSRYDAAAPEAGTKLRDPKKFEENQRIIQQYAQKEVEAQQRAATVESASKPKPLWQKILGSKPVELGAKALQYSSLSELATKIPGVGDDIEASLDYIPGVRTGLAVATNVPALLAAIPTAGGSLLGAGAVAAGAGVGAGLAEAAVTDDRPGKMGGFGLDLPGISEKYEPLVAGAVGGLASGHIAATRLTGAAGAARAAAQADEMARAASIGELRPGHRLFTQDIDEAAGAFYPDVQQPRFFPKRSLTGADDARPWVEVGLDDVDGFSQAYEFQNGSYARRPGVGGAPPPRATGSAIGGVDDAAEAVQSFRPIEPQAPPKGNPISRAIGAVDDFVENKALQIPFTDKTIPGWKPLYRGAKALDGAVANAVSKVAPEIMRPFIQATLRPSVGVAAYAVTHPEETKAAIGKVMEVDRAAGLQVAQALLPKTDLDLGIKGLHDVNVEGLGAELFRPTNFINFSPVGAGANGLKAVGMIALREGAGNAALAAIETWAAGGDRDAIIDSAMVGFGAGVALPVGMIGISKALSSAVGRMTPEQTAGAFNRFADDTNLMTEEHFNEEVARLEQERGMILGGGRPAEAAASVGPRPALFDNPDKVASIIEDTLPPDGGSSTQINSLASMTEGYGLSINPEATQVVPLADFEANGPQVLEQFAQSRGELLNSPDKFLGTWHDPDTGNVSLDVSTNVLDRQEAMNLMVQHNQRSMWSAADFEVVDNPQYDPSRGAEAEFSSNAAGSRVGDVADLKAQVEAARAAAAGKTPEQIAAMRPDAAAEAAKMGRVPEPDVEQPRATGSPIGEEPRMPIETRAPEEISQMPTTHRGNGDPTGTIAYLLQNADAADEGILKPYLDEIKRRASQPTPKNIIDDARTEQRWEEDVERWKATATRNSDGHWEGGDPTLEPPSFKEMRDTKKATPEDYALDREIEDAENVLQVWNQKKLDDFSKFQSETGRERIRSGDSFDEWASARDQSQAINRTATGSEVGGEVPKLPTEKFYHGTSDGTVHELDIAPDSNIVRDIDRIKPENARAMTSAVAGLETRNADIDDFISRPTDYSYAEVTELLQNAEVRPADVTTVMRAGGVDGMRFKANTAQSAINPKTGKAFEGENIVIYNPKSAAGSEFSIDESRLGTGEGSNMHGVGLYATSSRDIADFYSGHVFDGQGSVTGIRQGERRFVPSQQQIAASEVGGETPKLPRKSVIEKMEDRDKGAWSPTPNKYISNTKSRALEPDDILPDTPESSELARRSTAITKSDELPFQSGSYVLNPKGEFLRGMSRYAHTDVYASEIGDRIGIETFGDSIDPWAEHGYNATIDVDIPSKDLNKAVISVRATDDTVLKEAISKLEDVRDLLNVKVVADIGRGDNLRAVQTTVGDLIGNKSQQARIRQSLRDMPDPERVTGSEVGDETPKLPPTGSKKDLAGHPLNDSLDSIKERSAALSDSDLEDYSKWLSEVRKNEDGSRYRRYSDPADRAKYREADEAIKKIQSERAPRQTTGSEVGGETPRTPEDKFNIKDTYDRVPRRQIDSNAYGKLYETPEGKFEVFDSRWADVKTGQTGGSNGIKTFDTQEEARDFLESHAAKGARGGFSLKNNKDFEKAASEALANRDQQIPAIRDAEEAALYAPESEAERTAEEIINRLLDSPNPSHLDGTQWAEGTEPPTVTGSRIVQRGKGAKAPLGLVLDDGQTAKDLYGKAGVRAMREAGEEADRLYAQLAEDAGFTATGESHGARWRITEKAKTGERTTFVGEVGNWLPEFIRSLPEWAGIGNSKLRTMGKMLNVEMKWRGALTPKQQRTWFDKLAEEFEVKTDANEAFAVIKRVAAQEASKLDKTLAQSVDPRTGKPYGLPNRARIIRMLHASGDESGQWYEGILLDSYQKFGIEDGDRFLNILAATSQQKAPDVNLRLALNAYADYKLGLYDNPNYVTPGVMRPVANNIRAAIAGFAPLGRKINSFSQNLKLDDFAVTNDRWVFRVFGFNDSEPAVKLNDKGKPVRENGKISYLKDASGKTKVSKGSTASTYEFVSGMIRSIAADAGMTPREVQARLWVAARNELEGKDIRGHASSSPNASYENMWSRGHVDADEDAVRLVEAIEKMRDDEIIDIPDRYDNVANDVEEAFRKINDSEAYKATLKDVSIKNARAEADARGIPYEEGEDAVSILNRVYEGDLEQGRQFSRTDKAADDETMAVRAEGEDELDLAALRATEFKGELESFGKGEEPAKKIEKFLDAYYNAYQRLDPIDAYTMLQLDTRIQPWQRRLIEEAHPFEAARADTISREDLISNLRSRSQSSRQYTPEYVNPETGNMNLKYKKGELPEGVILGGIEATGSPTEKRLVSHFAHGELRSSYDDARQRSRGNAESLEMAEAESVPIRDFIENPPKNFSLEDGSAIAVQPVNWESVIRGPVTKKATPVFWENLTSLTKKIATDYFYLAQKVQNSPYVNRWYTEMSDLVDELGVRHADKFSDNVPPRARGIVIAPQLQGQYIVPKGGKGQGSIVFNPLGIIRQMNWIKSQVSNFNEAAGTHSPSDNHWKTWADMDDDRMFGLINASLANHEFAHEWAFHTPESQQEFEAILDDLIAHPNYKADVQRFADLYNEMPPSVLEEWRTHGLEQLRINTEHVNNLRKIQFGDWRESGAAASGVGTEPPRRGAERGADSSVRTSNDQRGDARTRTIQRGAGRTTGNAAESTSVGTSATASVVGNSNAGRVPSGIFRITRSFKPGDIESAVGRATGSTGGRWLKPAKGDQFVPRMSSMNDAVDELFNENYIRKFGQFAQAKVPGGRFLVKAVGGLAATASEGYQKAIVGYKRLLVEGNSRKGLIMHTLKAEHRAPFDRFETDGVELWRVENIRGVMETARPGDVMSSPSKYNLTEQQKNYVALHHKIIDDLVSEYLDAGGDPKILAEYGIEKRGDHYYPRTVIGKDGYELEGMYDLKGERIGTKEKSPVKRGVGSKQSFERHRAYETEADGGMHGVQYADHLTSIENFIDSMNYRIAGLKMVENIKASGLARTAKELADFDDNAADAKLEQARFELAKMQKSVDNGTNTQDHLIEQQRLYDAVKAEYDARPKTGPTSKRNAAAITISEARGGVRDAQRVVRDAEVAVTKAGSGKNRTKSIIEVNHAADQDASVREAKKAWDEAVRRKDSYPETSAEDKKFEAAFRRSLDNYEKLTKLRRKKRTFKLENGKKIFYKNTETRAVIGKSDIRKAWQELVDIRKKLGKDTIVGLEADYKMKRAEARTNVREALQGKRGLSVDDAKKNVDAAKVKLEAAQERLAQARLLGQNVRRTSASVVQSKASSPTEAAYKFGLEGDIIKVKSIAGLPGLQGQIFPETVADELMAALGEKGLGIPDGIKRLNDHARSIGAGADFGYLFLQGVPVMAANPVAWAKATFRSLQAFASPEAYARWAASKHAVASEATPYIGLFTGSDYFTALKGSPIKQLSDSKAPGVTGLARKAVGKPMLRFATSFDAFLDASKMYLWEGMSPHMKTPADKESFGRLIRNLTGTTDSARLGVAAGQRELEGFLAFSPRFTRSVFALALQMFERGPAAARARKSVASMLVGAALLFYGTKMALYEKGVIDEPPSIADFDPSQGGRFMSIKIGDNYYGIGGSVRGVVQLIGGSVMHPENLKELDSSKNPFLRYARGRLSPAAGQTVNLATGKTVIGEDVSDRKQWLMTLPDSYIPFGARALAEGEGGIDEKFASFGASVVGGRSYPESSSESLNEKVVSALRGSTTKGFTSTDKKEIKSWSDLTTQQKVNLLEEHPELQKELDKKDAEQWNEYKQLVEDANKQKADLGRQWALTQAQTGGEKTTAEDITSVEYREALETINVKLSAARATLYGGNPFTGEGSTEFERPANTHRQQVMKAYYEHVAPDKYMNFTTGKPDFAKKEKLESEFLSQLSTGDRDLIAEETAGTSFDIVERKLKESRVTFREYFNIPDYVAQELGYNSELEVKLSGDEALIKKYDKRERTLKEAYRKENPEIDEDLKRWGYVTTTMDERAPSGGGGSSYKSPYKSKAAIKSPYKSPY